MDTVAWRLAARGWLRSRDLRRGERAGIPPLPPRDAPSAHAPIESLAKGLSAARRAHAPETAAAFASELARRQESGAASLESARLAEVLRTLLTVGDRERARRLADRHARMLAGTPQGCSVLELLSIGVPFRPWLPNGRPNLLGAARRLQRGVDPASLLEPLARRPLAWLRTPQLHLLAFDVFAAREPARAQRHLDRFGVAHGWTPARVTPGRGSFLTRVRFDPEPAVTEGPLVSVILSAYEAAETVEYALRSVLSQSYRNLEVLVCDDASRDETGAILGRLAEDPRVRLFRSRGNQGTYNVRNALLERARGAFVTFHDADDVALPGRIALQVRALRASDAVACTTRWLRVTEGGRFVFFADQSAVRQSVVSLMMRRDAFDAVGPYRQVRFGADYELLVDLRVRFGSRVRALRTPQILGLWSDRSLTRAAGSEALEDGYQAPARRRYTELVAWKHGRDGPSDDEIDAALATTGNRAEPRGVEELTARPRR